MSSCASITGVVSLDADGWLFERPWNTQEWVSRAQIGPGILHGCVASADQTLVLFEAAAVELEQSVPRQVNDEHLPLETGGAVLVLTPARGSHGIAFSSGWLRLPQVETQVAATSSLAELAEAVRVSWTPLSQGEHEEPTTRVYSYEIASNQLTVVE